MSTEPSDRPAPLFTPLTIAQAMAATGRSKRTIDRWIREGHLRKVPLDGQPVLVEEEVLEYEKRMADNLRESRRISAEPGAPTAS